MQITKREKSWLKEFNHLEEYYITRDSRERLFIHTNKPEKDDLGWFTKWEPWGDFCYGSLLPNHIFSFITWKSGKAWSKSELMELEVAE